MNLCLIGHVFYSFQCASHGLCLLVIMHSSITFQMLIKQRKMEAPYKTLQFQSRDLNFATNSIKTSIKSIMVHTLPESHNITTSLSYNFWPISSTWSCCELAWNSVICTWLYGDCTFLKKKRVIRRRVLFYIWLLQKSSQHWLLLQQRGV